MTLIDRVKNILLTPKTEWPVIAAETSTVQSILVGYVLILVAIGPLALLIATLGSGLEFALLRYVIALAITLLLALTFVGAAVLVFGLMTPFVAFLVAAGGIGVALSWIPSPAGALFDSYVALINLIALSIAIAFLGPGAFSLDARMFGRREITIPSSSNADGDTPPAYWKM